MGQCPVTMELQLVTTTHTMDTQAMCVKNGWTARLLTLKGREMELESMAEFLRLKSMDSNSAQSIGKLLQHHWLTYLHLRESQILDIPIQKPRQTKLMATLILMLHLLRLLINHIQMTMLKLLHQMMQIIMKRIFLRILRKKLPNKRNHIKYSQYQYSNHCINKSCDKSEHCLIILGDYWSSPSEHLQTINVANN